MIRELRVGAADHAMAGWDDAEDSLVLAVTGFSLRRWEFNWHFELLASLSLRGLARRFQRGADRTHAAAMRDLTLLAASATDERLSKPGDFQIDVPGGCWAGRVSMIQDGSRTLAVRTYL